MVHRTTTRASMKAEERFEGMGTNRTVTIPIPPRRVENDSGYEKHKVGAVKVTLITVRSGYET